MSSASQTARPLPSVVQPPTIAFHPQDRPTPADLAALPCPNCGGTHAKSLVLTIDVQLPDNPSKRLRLLHCPDCTAHFYDSQVPPDYAEPALNNRGRVPFYVQQGAGVSLITKPLAQLRAPPGASYMEVGCGYGFGLDFALNTKGWTGTGIDPAPLAALGRDALNLPIELRYLQDDDEAKGTIDVVLGSEVIEHVTSPAAFVRTLRAMLRPGGVMVLTTPNGADIRPDTPPGIIIPLLSPSLHLVIQNRRSLEALLRQGGFAHVDVDVDSHSLVAFASDVPLDLEHGRAPLRQALRTHLERRAGEVDTTSDLFVAFAGRAFMENVNDGVLDAADRAWAMLLPACRSRYGIDLDAITALPEAVATCSLEEMARLVPLNLAGLLYLRGIRLLSDGTRRAALEPQFLLAAEAADAMRRALGELAMEDGQTEDIGWTARAEALLCAADAGAGDLTARYAALPPAPNGGEARRRVFALRMLSNLVNAGQHAPARDLVRDLGLDASPLSAGVEAERDALFALAVLDAQPEGRPDRARARFAAVRETAPPGGDLWLATLRGEAQALRLAGDTEALAGLAEAVAAQDATLRTVSWAVVTLVNMGAYDRARVLATRPGLTDGHGAATSLDALPLSAGDETERDALFALAMLGTQPGADGGPADPMRARGRFAAVRGAVAPGGDLWWAALRGEALALGQAGDASALRALAGEAVRQHRTPRTIGWAVVTLVNAGAYPAARAVAAEPVTPGGPGLDAMPLSTEVEAERDALFALATLDAQPDPEADGGAGQAARARARFKAVRDASTPGGDLWQAALRGEVQALGLTGQTDALGTLLTEAARQVPAPEVSGWAVVTLVNAGAYAAAHGVAEMAGLAAASDARPGDQTWSAAARDLTFCLAVLDLQAGLPGRDMAEPARARDRFARVRGTVDAGSGLWWGALRGELQALDMLDARDEAQALVAGIEAAHPGLEMPADVLVRVGKA